MPGFRTSSPQNHNLNIILVFYSIIYVLAYFQNLVRGIQGVSSTAVGKGFDSRLALDFLFSGMSLMRQRVGEHFHFLAHTRLHLQNRAEVDDAIVCFPFWLAEEATRRLAAFFYSPGVKVKLCAASVMKSED